MIDLGLFPLFYLRVHKSAVRLFSPLGSQVLTPVAFSLVANSSSSSSSLPLQADSHALQGAQPTGPATSTQTSPLWRTLLEGHPGDTGTGSSVPSTTNPSLHPRTWEALMGGTGSTTDFWSVSDGREEDSQNSITHRIQRKFRGQSGSPSGATESCFWEAGLHF